MTEDDSISSKDRSAGALADWDRTYSLHPMSDWKRDFEEGPLIVVTEGRGIHVIDDKGKEYIEAFSGLWCASLGFSEARLVDAATKQLRRLPFYHQFRGMAHEPGIRLAKELVAVAPPGLHRVFLTNSGSEATDTLIKTVRYYNNAVGRPNKKKIISRLGSYHGTTLGAASLSGQPAMHAHFDLPIPGFLYADCPHQYRFGLPGETEEAFGIRMARNLEELILKEDPKTVAAFVIDPVMAGAGIVIPGQIYYQAIQEILRKYDVLLCVDEIVCGFGRTGCMFGSEYFNLSPDIIVIGKALSSAYFPISGLMVSTDIADTIAPQTAEIGAFSHGFTHSGHPVGCAVALETLKVLEERQILKHVRNMSEPFQSAIGELARHPLVGHTRGIGLLGALELVTDKDTKTPLDKSCVRRLQERALDAGLIFRYSNNAILLAPPLCITRVELSELFDRLQAVLDAVAKDVRIGVRETTA